MYQIESFFWGIIAALGALFVELLIFIGFSFYADPTMKITFAELFVLPAFIFVGAFFEEAFKYLIVSKRVERVSLEKSYIINSLFVGAGFFAVEFGLIAYSVLPPLRVLGEIAIVHLGTSGIIGYIIALNNIKKVGTFLFALAITTFFHASYNYLIISRSIIENYTIYALLLLLIFSNIINFLRISRKLARS